MNEPTKALAATQRWVERIVIGERFCPFAKPVADASAIRYCETPGDDWSVLTSTLQDECRRLDGAPNTRTTLVVVVSGLDDFYVFLDALAFAEAQMRVWGYEGVYQLASFHPDYLFDGEETTSSSHYTNRSPFPTFHLIREEDITALGLTEEQSESIYERNITHAKRLGMAFFEHFLRECRQ